MRSGKAKLTVAVLVGVSTLIGVLWVVSIRNSALRALEDERNRSARNELIPFKRVELTPYAGNDVKLIQTTREVRGLVTFQGSYFAATGGGLLKLSSDGEVLRRYTVLGGLPENDLTTAAVYHDTLFIGTRSKGLVTFDGEHFSGYRWSDREAQTVTSMAVSGGDLLIGTFAGGLIKFDGTTFTETKPNGERIMRITRVVVDGPRLYVGTFDSGVWLYEDDTWSHVTSADSLPADRVVGIAVGGGRVYIATDLGLAVHDSGGTRKVVDAPMLSDAAISDNRLLFTKDSGELMSFDRSLSTVSERGGVREARLENAGGRLFEISDSGIAEIENGHLRPFYQPEAEMLSNNLVSALAMDRGSELWVGSFRSGIDVVSGATGKTRHVETEAVREINFLQADGDGMSAATTGGLVTLGMDLKVKQNLTKSDQLPSNSVMHFTGDAIATAKGLAFLNKGKPTILSTVQGLPSNSVYTTLKVGDRLYAGTLGGLAEIENKRVNRTFTASNSALTTNWVTSLCQAGDRLFIGTYGGGVFELTSAGEIHSFQPEAGRFTVNMNAIYSDGERLYVGSLDGVRVLDLRSQKWQTVRDVLPSENVMSITGDDSAVYFGTSSGIARVEKRHFSNVQNERL
jgi:ligand-binding sensor domain-containing protein